jgi:hypothetical protein
MSNVRQLKIPWHRPKIVTIEQTGPFCAFMMLTMLDGSIRFIRNIPTVVNSTDKANQREQWRASTRRSRALKKKLNPVTKRIFSELDEAVFKMLEDNPFDADGRPIPFEEAKQNMIADFVQAGVKKK